MSKFLSSKCSYFSRAFQCTRAKAAKKKDPAPEELDTVIFVDCDGVLNVAIADGTGSLPLDSKNLEVARRIKLEAEAEEEEEEADFDQVAPCDLAVASKRVSERSYVSERSRVSDREKETAECVLAVVSRRVSEKEKDTYNKFIATPGSGLSDVLVGRLAKLIRMAGAKRRVVLTSTWRNPNFAPRVKKLEAMLSEHLGVNFVFDATTPLITGRETPQLRIKLIGDYLSNLCASRNRSNNKKLMALVLDDFDCTAPEQLTAGGQLTDSVEKVEKYLESLANDLATVKVVHMHDQWASESGQQMRVGTGLTVENYLDAAIFLGQGNLQCLDDEDADDWQRRASSDSTKDEAPGLLRGKHADQCFTDEQIHDGVRI